MSNGIVVWEQVADKRIKPVVYEANEKALPDLLADPPQLEDVLGSEIPCSAPRIHSFMSSNEIHIALNSWTVLETFGFIC